MILCLMNSVSKNVIIMRNYEYMFKVCLIISAMSTGENMDVSP